MRIGLKDYLWRPRRVFNSVEEWAVTCDCESTLRPIPQLNRTNGRTNPGWHVVNLPGGKVVGDMRLIATSENAVLGHLQSLHGIEVPEAHWSLKQWRLRRPRHLHGSVAVVAAASGSNYYHWLFDSLPRLHLLRLAGFEWSQMESFLISGLVQAFDLASLALLGIPPERVVRCSKRRITLAEHLIVPPMPTPQQGKTAPWVCDFLRASFLSQNQPTEPGAKLYLSRRNSSKRRLANEVEIESFFCERGFRSICLEKLSFQEQVQIFAGAAFVAGPHGAGFANLVFAPPGTQVVELFHPGHPAYLYKALAEKLGMNYQCVLGKATDEEFPQMSEKLGPYTIELTQVKELFNN